VFNRTAFIGETLFAFFVRRFSRRRSCRSALERPRPTESSPETSSAGDGNSDLLILNEYGPLHLNRPDYSAVCTGGVRLLQEPRARARRRQ
jgi:hypothetical protein